jgi:hypothetical protein
MVFSMENSLKVYPAIPILKVFTALSAEVCITLEAYSEDVPAARIPVPANFKNLRREFIFLF